MGCQLVVGVMILVPDLGPIWILAAFFGPRFGR